jgi:hypothetical protein
VFGARRDRGHSGHGVSRNARDQDTLPGLVHALDDLGNLVGALTVTEDDFWETAANRTFEVERRMFQFGDALDLHLLESVIDVEAAGLDLLQELA